MKKYTDPLVPGQFYHVFNRGINSCRIFDRPENYYFFLRKFYRYIIPVADIYAYCLLPNHFHFLLQVHEMEALNTPAELAVDPSLYASRQFARCFNSYAQAYNRQSERTGGLFEEPFRRKLIRTEEQWRRCMLYIHTNPLKHGVCRDFTTYRFSSYQSVLGKTDGMLKAEEAHRWFDDADQFEALHLFYASCMTRESEFSLI